VLQARVARAWEIAEEELVALPLVSDTVDVANAAGNSKRVLRGDKALVWDEALVAFLLREDVLVVDEVAIDNLDALALGIVGVVQGSLKTSHAKLDSSVCEVADEQVLVDEGVLAGRVTIELVLVPATETVRWALSRRSVNGEQQNG
jgi:hypothetical protein